MEGKRHCGAAGMGWATLTQSIPGQGVAVRYWQGLLWWDSDGMQHPEEHGQEALCWCLLHPSAPGTFPQHLAEHPAECSDSPNTTMLELKPHTIHITDTDCHQLFCIFTMVKI